ncbi:MAG: hypothetical protein QM750_11740 [Rubrivivax sp.]
MADAAPLLAPGIHRMTEAELEALAVSAFGASVRRPVLHRQFVGWLNALRAANVSGPCWLDGSFLTAKLDPNDIDLVLFPSLLVPPTPALHMTIGPLFDQALVKAQFGLDLYLVDPGAANVMEMTSYWRGWFGFCRDGVTAKGIAEVML